MEWRFFQGFFHPTFFPLDSAGTGNPTLLQSTNNNYTK